MFPHVFPLALLNYYLLSLPVFPIGRSTYAPRGLQAPQLLPVLHLLPRPKGKMQLGLLQSFLLNSVSDKGFP